MSGLPFISQDFALPTADCIGLSRVKITCNDIIEAGAGTRDQSEGMVREVVYVGAGGERDALNTSGAQILVSQNYQSRLGRCRKYVFLCTEEQCEVPCILPRGIYCCGAVPSHPRPDQSCDRRTVLYRALHDGHRSGEVKSNMRQSRHEFKKIRLSIWGTGLWTW